MASSTDRLTAFVGPSRSEPTGDVASRLLRYAADESLTVIILVAVSDHRILYANRAAYRAARGLPDDLVGTVATHAFPFLDPARFASKPTGTSQIRSVAERHGDETVWWDVSYVAPESAPAEFGCVLVDAVDVTHHHIAKAEAEAARETLDALLAYIPQGISIARGPEVRVDRISAWGMALIGRSNDEVVGRSALQQDDVWEVYRPGSAAPLSAAERPLARATHTGEIVLNETLMIRCADHRMLTVLCSSGPIRDGNGRVIGALMAWQDTTELQRAHAALRARDERLRAVLSQIPAAILVVEAPDGRVAFRSDVVDELLGHPEYNLTTTRTTLQGWALHEDGSAYDLSEYPSRRALMRGETVRGEPMKYRRGDGRLIDLEMHAGPIRDETGVIVAAVAVALDVTERRSAEARQAFLFDLQDSLRNLSESSEILTAAAVRLGKHLGAARVGYGEMQPDDETIRIINGYSEGLPAVNGLYPLTVYGPHHAAQMREGHTMSYEDVQAEAHVPPEVAFKIGTRAHIAVPLIRNGRFTGALYVTHRKPHRWTRDEIALIEQVAGRVWDAAERGRSDARLRDSERRLRLVIDSTRLGIWEYDSATGTTTHSARHDEILGYAEPPSDWSLGRFLSHFAQPDRIRIEASVRAALEQGAEFALECRMTRADGCHGWVKVCARPHSRLHDRGPYLLGSVADITDHKDAERAASETAAKFEMLAQAMPSMAWTSLPDGRIDWFNQRVLEYCGIPEAQMKPDGWAPVHPDDVERSTRHWQEAVATGAPFVSEYRIRRHDGQFRWHITRAVPIRDSRGVITRWVGASADIEDQKNTEQSLVHLNSTLEQQVRQRTQELLLAEAALRQSQKMEAIGQLTGGLAHDFNNLLTGVTGSLELMALRLAQGKVNQLDRYLQVAQDAAKRATALTHRLLAFARRQTLDPKPTDVNQLVHGMGDLIRRTVGPAVAVTVVDTPCLWLVLADPNQLESALLNLCINARDAMPDGGALTIEAANRVLDENEAKELQLSAGEYVSLRVTDTGAGMTPEVIERAFDPFFTTKPIGAGTGLGLSMVYGFVRQSGGQARIHSVLEKGTKVCLDLPRYSGDRAMDATAGLPQARRGGGETVLVVDDETSVRILINDVLRELGYTVLQADHGAAGLRILDSTDRVDLLVTDVGLPGGMNGRQLADAALVSRPDLKVLFITGYAEHAVLGAGHLKPGMHLLTKPFSLETLGSRIKEIVGDK